MGAKQQGATATQNRWVVIPRTLCFVTHGEDVLLMKRGPNRRVFPNQYNGLGGHIERNEDPYTGARREIKEESGLDVRNLMLKSVHNIDTGENTGIILFVFTANALSRDFHQITDEGKLEWVPLSSLEQFDLVEDLPLIMPRVLPSTENSGVLFAHVSYNEQDEIQIHFATDDNS